MTAEPPFLTTFRQGLARVGGHASVAGTPDQHIVRSAADAVAALPHVSRATLTGLLTDPPAGLAARDVLRALGLGVSLSKERLASEMAASIGGSVVRGREAEVVAWLDDRFGVVARLAADRDRAYTWTDVLVARAGTRATAGKAVAGGRSIEDAIEAVAASLGLPYEVRTRFVGVGGQDAPCDLAIPAGGDAALIVCAAKGFDSTGSKLTDAVREIEQMATVRLPRQYVFAVVDGIGWLRRGRDLARIVAAHQESRIDGLFQMGGLDAFAAALEDAARRLGLTAARPPAAVGRRTPAPAAAAPGGRQLHLLPHEAGAPG